jgi:predicted nucleotidyltransferase
LGSINQTLDEALAEQEGDFDSNARWALTWFEQMAFNRGAGICSMPIKHETAHFGGRKAMHPALNLDERTLAQYCERHHIRRLSLFGSQLRGTAQADSDIDLLVEFDPDHTPTLFGIAGMEIELTDMLGRKVDLRTAGDLSRYFRDEVVRTAEVQYAA